MLGANHVPVGPMRRDELAARSCCRRSAPACASTRAGRCAGRRRRGRAGRAAVALDGAARAVAAARRAAAAASRAYERAGGVHGAVARLAERVYEGLDPEERAGRAGDPRAAGGRPARARPPCAGACRSPSSSASGVPTCSSELADGRLVTSARSEAEVAHEALLREWPRLRGWLEEDVEGRRLHHDLGIAAREWNARGRDRGELYRGARLASALDWAAAHEQNSTRPSASSSTRAGGERAARTAACGPRCPASPRCSCSR